MGDIFNVIEDIINNNECCEEDTMQSGGVFSVYSKRLDYIPGVEHMYMSSAVPSAMYNIPISINMPTTSYNISDTAELLSDIAEWQAWRNHWNVDVEPCTIYTDIGTTSSTRGW